MLFLKITSEKREPKRIVGKFVHNNVYFCDSIAVTVNCYSSICYGWQHDLAIKFRVYVMMLFGCCLSIKGYESLGIKRL